MEAKIIKIYEIKMCSHNKYFVGVYVTYWMEPIDLKISILENMWPGKNHFSVKILIRGRDFPILSIYLKSILFPLLLDIFSLIPDFFFFAKNVNHCIEKY